MKGLMMFPGTIPVGCVVTPVPQDPGGAKSDEHATGVPTGGMKVPGGGAWLGITLGTTGKSQPADVLDGKTVLRVSVWKGLWIPLDPA